MKNIVIALVLVSMFTVVNAQAPKVENVTNTNTPEVKKAIDDAVAKALAAKQPAPAQTPEQLKDGVIKLFERARSDESPFTVACKAVGASVILVSLAGGQANLVCPVPLKAKRWYWPWD